jgi:hypothetical protein
MTTAEMTRELTRMQRKVKAANVLDSSAARTALAAIARARYALRAMAAEVTYYTLTAA